MKKWITENVYFRFLYFSVACFFFLLSLIFGFFFIFEVFEVLFYAIRYYKWKNTNTLHYWVSGHWSWLNRQIKIEIMKIRVIAYFNFNFVNKTADHWTIHALLCSSPGLPLASAPAAGGPPYIPPRGPPLPPRPRINGNPPRPRPRGLPRVISDSRAVIIGLYCLLPLPTPGIFFLFGYIVIWRPLNNVPSKLKAFDAVSALTNST